MTNKTDPGEIHELSGGWITERTRTKIPPFLKLSYVGFSLFGVVYLFRYVMGEVDHATRGTLVQQFNAVADKPPAAWITFLAVVLVTFVAGLLWYAFLAKSED
jgi:hypothetical protein